MRLHLWDEAQDLSGWYAWRERRPVACGKTVNYQEITRDPENVTCGPCEEAMARDGSKPGRAH